MSTRPILILTSENEVVTKSLEQYIGLFAGKEIPHKIEPLTRTSPEELLGKLDDLEREEIFNTVVVFDLTSIVDSNYLRITATDCLPAELVLSYPEIYWIFVYSGTIPLYKTSNDKTNGELNDISKKIHFVNISEMSRLLELLKRHAGGFRTIFDPTGFRWQVGRCRRRRSEAEETPDDWVLKIGASIDEEKSFSLLNGYLLYRYGYGTYIVSTLSEMLNIFQTGKTDPQVVPDFVLEDVNLRFPDATPRNECEYFLVSRSESDKSNLNKDLLQSRALVFANLPKDEKKRIIVSQDSFNLWDGQSLQKPYRGIFEKNLPLELRKYSRFQFHADGDKIDTNHSARNKNQKIAESLMRRARKMANGEIPVEDAVHAAVLSEEAKRLLGGKTLALSLEALKLKHCMEVTAECTFVGASDVDVEMRFDEIEKEVKKMHASPMQEISARVEIADDLRQIYREYEQFEEEERALERVREYRWMLKYAADTCNVSDLDVTIKKSSRLKRLLTQHIKCVNGLEAAPSLYFIWLIGSFKRILAAIAVWILVFAFFYYPLLDNASPTHFIMKLFNSILYSALTFFEMQPADGTYIKANLCPHYSSTIAFFELALAYAHLGIFISYLYQKISRK